MLTESAQSGAEPDAQGCQAIHLSMEQRASHTQPDVSLSVGG